MIPLASTQVSAADTILWVAVPYICLAVFIVGHLWRYRYDKFGWTTRSSQLYESRLLRLGSPLFHFGILFVLMGHVMGLGVPESWTEAVGISEGMYHVMAVGVGSIAGFCTLVGMAILIYRRRTVGPVFSATKGWTWSIESRHLPANGLSVGRPVRAGRSRGRLRAL